MRRHDPIGSPVLAPARHVPSFVLATADRPQLRLCRCAAPSLCRGHDGRSPEGAHCQGHVAPQLAEDES